MFKLDFVLTVNDNTLLILALAVESEARRLSCGRPSSIFRIRLSFTLTSMIISASSTWSG